MRLIDAEDTPHPCFGARQSTHWLRKAGYPVTKKRVQRLMHPLGLAAISPKPALSKPSPGHPVYPYLLRGVKVEQGNQDWSADITSIRLAHGWMYLGAMLDWCSR
jgi:putative transposase